MAARLHPAPSPGSQVIELQYLNARELDPLLEEESAAWREELEWDFEKSADLVRRFVDLRALNGCALLEEGQVAGYLYYVLEDDKALIGDLYVRRAWRSADRENLLLEAALEAIVAMPQIQRVESQLLMLEYAAGREVPRPRYASGYERNFMRVDLASAALREDHVRRPTYIEQWSEHYQD